MTSQVGGPSRHSGPRRFRLLPRLALPLFALLLLTACDDSPPYNGAGLPQGYKKFERDPNPVVELATDAGNIKIELFEDRAPDTVDNFIELVESGKYNGLTFHRIIKDFMIQGGDPKGDGTGGPGYKFHDELGDDNKNDQYSVAMANSGPNTNGSQFFIVTAPKGAHWLDKKHTVFGKVIEGKEVVDKLNLTPVTGDKPNTPPKIVTAKALSKRNREYKLADAVKQKDTPPPMPRTITIPPGTHTPADIKRIQEEAAKQPPPPAPPAKTPDPSKPDPAKPPAPIKPADPVKPAETKPAENKPVTPPQK